MRLGVLDVGSNTVHLLIVDAHRGARPLPASKRKVDLGLSTLMDADGCIGEHGQRQLVRCLDEARALAEDRGAEAVIGFATSAIRDAGNGEAVIERVRREAGVHLQVLPGEEEARLTFLAVRRWYGWSSRRLLVLDIGGGSLEVASGIDEDPDVALSWPLGANRLTLEHLDGDPPPAEQVHELRRQVRRTLARQVGDVLRVGPPDRTVGTSKTFRSLARIGGAAPSSEGPYVRRLLRRDALPGIVDQLAGLTAKERARLPGVSASRAEQLLAGALVAHAAMDLLEVDEVEICPWALREGVLLRRLDAYADAGEPVPARG